MAVSDRSRAAYQVGWPRLTYLSNEAFRAAAQRLDTLDLLLLVSVVELTVAVVRNVVRNHCLALRLRECNRELCATIQVRHCTVEGFRTPKGKDDTQIVS